MFEKVQLAKPGPNEWANRVIYPIRVNGRKTGQSEFYKEANGDIRWRLVRSNGKIVAEGGEGYDRKSGAVNGLRSAGQLMAAWLELLDAEMKPED